MSYTLVAEVDGNTFWRNPFSSLCNPRQLEEFIVMDIDIIRDQKLGAGAGLRSNKVSVCVCVFVFVVAEEIALLGNIALLLEAKSIVNHYIIPQPVCWIHQVCLFQ